MSYFYGVYPADRVIGRLFDLARLIVQPDYARKAHITLRGPYEERPPPRSKWLRLKLTGSRITRPSRFFNEFQNTVYLGVSFFEMNDVSWKRDFQSAIPHMSIYDGDDRSFAWQVFSILNEFNWQMPIEFTPVLILERKKEYFASFFLELDEIDMAFEYIAERPLNRDYMKSMHIGQRVFLLRKICERITALNRPSSTPK